MISERDAAALLEIVDEGLTASGSEPFPPSVLSKLGDLIPSDATVGYQEIELVPRGFRPVDVVEIVGESLSPAEEDACRALGRQNPLRCHLHARTERVLRLSDSIGMRERRRLAFYAEVWRPHGIEDALRLWLPAPPGRARSVYLERSGPNYSERDKKLLALLRPHLIRIRSNAEFRRRGNGAFGLTARESEVLGWIERGKTNDEIASILHISPHTVRKHTEHVFEKLGVHTRTAAAARMHMLSPRPLAD